MRIELNIEEVILIKECIGSVLTAKQNRNHVSAVCRKATEDKIRSLEQLKAKLDPIGYCWQDID